MRLRWRNAMFQKRQFRIVWSDSRNLSVLLLLCTWARHLKTGTQRSQAICTSVVPASNTPINKKIDYINTLHLYPTKTNKHSKVNKESYRILISSCWTTDIQLFDFYRKRGLGPDQSHCNQSRLWSRLQTTLAKITRIATKWTFIESFFTVHDFWATCACLKNRVVWEFLTVLKYILSFRIFEQLALALKNWVALKFLIVLNIYLHSEFLSNLRLS